MFPDETPTPVTVTPETHAIDALRIMLEKRYTQLPVIDDASVRGVFSLWSLASYLGSGHGPPIAELLVEDVMGSLPQVTVNTSVYEVLDNLEDHEAVLVMSPSGLQAIATSWDVLQYFFGVARPYVLLQEIELGLRLAIDAVIPVTEIEGSIQASVAKAYRAKGQTPPTSLEEFAFEDYKTLITSRDNWPRFLPLLRSSKPFVGARLERVRQIRNLVFHFRADLTVVDYEDLVSVRQWLLDRMRTSPSAATGVVE